MALQPFDISQMPKKRSTGGFEEALSGVGQALQAGGAYNAPQAQPAPQIQPVNTNFMPGRKQQYQEGPSGFESVIGNIGDAISVGAGGQPYFEQGQQQRRFENAITAYQNDPQQGIGEVMQVAPEVGLQLNEQQMAEEQAREERMMKVAPQMRRDLEQAVQQGGDPAAVLERYARNPQVGPDLFDDQAEVDEMKAMLAQDPQSVIQSLPQGEGQARLITGEEATAAGFEPGTVAEYIPGKGYNVLQEAESVEPERANIVPRGGDQPVSAMINPNTGVATWFEDGQRRFARPGEYSTVGQNVQGTREDVLGDTEARKLRDAEVATKQYIATTKDALRLLQDSPDINTFTSRAAGLVNDLQQEVKAGARALGKDFDEDVLDPSKYQDSFDNLGIQNRRMQSMVTSLAFQAAAASGQTGRSVSDRDVSRFMSQIGAASADPRAFAQVLQDQAQRTARNFEINYESRLDQPYQGDLGLSDMPGGPQGESAELPRVNSDEDFEQLPSGAEFIAPDGTRRRKP